MSCGPPRATPPACPGTGRTLAPVYSLDARDRAAAARRLGRGRAWAAGRSFTDHRHLIIYGQRTADDRLAFGGRGAPYHLGSRVQPAYDREPAVFDALHRILVELFPALAAVAITHTWGGPLGVPRDWFPSVGLDRATGLAWGGGYVGDGVAAANLAGRTLADLILERDTDLVTLPWVRHRSPSWEPEPLRWLGSDGGAAGDGRRGRGRIAYGSGRQARGLAGAVAGAVTGLTVAALPGDALEFMAARHLATLTTLRPDGTPHVVPVGFSWDDEAKVARVITGRNTRKARNVGAGSRAALCQVEGWRWITLEGPARVVADPASVADAVERYAARYRAPRENPERVVLEVSVERVDGPAQPAETLVNPAG